jgi:hypothetical protein
MTAGVALVGASLRRGGDDGRPGDGAAVWWFLLAGFSSAGAYLVRELSVFLCGCRRRAGLAAALRRWVQVALPMLGCLVLEMVLARGRGDPLARPRSTASTAALAVTDHRTDALLRFPRIVEVYPQTMVVLARSC